MGDRRPVLRGGRSACDAFQKPGSDLLSHALRHSTIGAGGFNGRVRNGIGWRPPARATRLSKRATLPASSLKERRAVRSRHVIVVRCDVVFQRGLGPRHKGPQNPRRRSEGSLKIKPIERLGPVSFMRCRTSTPGLSTWWSSTALKGNLVLRGASRLDAFSGYPFHT